MTSKYIMNFFERKKARKLMNTYKNVATIPKTLSIISITECNRNDLFYILKEKSLKKNHEEKIIQYENCIEYLSRIKCIKIKNKYETKKKKFGYSFINNITYEITNKGKKELKKYENYKIKK